MGKYKYVKDTDRGWKKLSQELIAANNYSVDIGVQAGEMADGGFDMAALAATHEFGATVKLAARTVTTYHRVSKTGNFKKGFAKRKRANFAMDHQIGASTIDIPARPFLRNSFDENLDEMTAFVQSVFRRVFVCQILPLQALHLTGQKFTGIVQRKIVDGPWKPNSRATIRRKGSNRPLIDTGRLRQSIRHVVRKR